MISDSYQVFKCPNCQNYISNKMDFCRFCNFPLTDEIKSSSFVKETEDSRQYRRKNHKMMLYVGLGIFILGLGISTISLISIGSGQGIIFPWSPVVILGGVGQILYSLFGMWEERRK